MGFNWKAIQSYEDAEVALYRLLGEMLRRKATLGDLDQIRAFLLGATLSSDAWLSLGEALHRTTSGSPVGYDIWLAWLETFDDLEVDDDRLGDRWMEFGEDVSEASEDYDPNVDVLPSPEAPDVPSAQLSPITGPSEPKTLDDLASVADDDDTDMTDGMASQPLSRRTHTGMLGESPTQLLRLVPQGPFEVRLFNEEYTGVDEYTVLTLLKRGLFLAADVRFGGDWLPAWEHPAFEIITDRLRIEAARVLSRDKDDDATNPLES